MFPCGTAHVCIFMCETHVDAACKRRVFHLRRRGHMWGPEPEPVVTRDDHVTAIRPLTPTVQVHSGPIILSARSELLLSCLLMHRNAAPPCRRRPAGSAPSKRSPAELHSFILKEQRVYTSRFSSTSQGESLFCCWGPRGSWQPGG